PTSPLRSHLLPYTTLFRSTVYRRTAEFCAVRPEAPKKRGRVLAVFSSKGGTGTTFIATNVAAALGAPTVLVDLNLQAGDLGLFLDRKSTRLESSHLVISYA